MRKAIIVLLSLSLSLVACACQRGESAQGRPLASVVDADTTASATLWPRFFAELEGTFVATTPSGATITVVRRSVARGSAHIESFVTPSAETITMYHPDGDTVLMTHYCGQGNQALLVAQSSTEDSVVFTRLRATNVGPDQGVMSKLELRLRDDGYEQKETYTAGDQVETSTLHFIRQ